MRKPVVKKVSPQKPKKRVKPKRGVGQGVGGGRPSHVPSDATRQLVRMMVIESYSIAKICSHVKVDPKTLRRYYAEEIEHSKVNADVLMAQSIFL